MDGVLTVCEIKLTFVLATTLGEAPPLIAGAVGFTGFSAWSLQNAQSC
jgi:hypothetical protein